MIDSADDGWTLVTGSSALYILSTVYIYELSRNSTLCELLDNKDYRADQVTGGSACESAVDLAQNMVFSTLYIS